MAHPGDLVHFDNLTPVNRMLASGCNASLAVGGDSYRDENPITFAMFEADVPKRLPAVRDLCTTHGRGGPVSALLRMIPAMSHLTQDRIVFSLSGLRVLDRA
jgi:hypothetical protein